MNKQQIAASVNAFMLMVISFFGFAQHQTSPIIERATCDMPQDYWTPRLAKNYAKVRAAAFGWNRSEWKALNKLWTAESNWRAEAFNKQPDLISGEHAGGIPQILGLNPETPAPLQIERGLAYISARYDKPSAAWSHHRTHGWY